MHMCFYNRKPQVALSTVKFLKIQTSEKKAVITLKFDERDFTIE